MTARISSIWQGSLAPGMPRSQRSSCRYEAFVPDRLADVSLALPEAIVADVSEAERQIQRLNTGAPELASLEALARLLLRAEAVASSKIEGLEVGARRLVRAEAAREVRGPSSDTTAESVLGNIEAMVLATEQVANKEHVGVEDILSVHQALMRHTDRPEIGGQVRTVQNWIGGSSFSPCTAVFVPPPPEIVPELLDDLIEFVNSDRYPALVQAGLAHGQFETIHPFIDGNGRVGRALIHVVLRRRGLSPRFIPPISLVLATRSTEYVRGLMGLRYEGLPDSLEALAGVSQWIDIFTFAAKHAAESAERFSAAIDSIVSGWRVRLGNIRAGSTVDLLIRVLPSAPVITVDTAARLVHRSTQATNLAVERLSVAGILTPTRDVRRNRTFEVRDILDAVTHYERALASELGDTRVSPPRRHVPPRPVRPAISDNDLRSSPLT
ncbi:MAG: Fic family protein [Chloroflexota bacterium]